MGIKTVPQPPYSPDLTPCDFWLFPKLRGCRYETIEEMKEAVTKVIDTLTQKDFHGAFQKLSEWYNVHCSWRRLFRRGRKFHICTINKSAHTKKVGKLIKRSSYLSILHILLANPHTKIKYIIPFKPFLDILTENQNGNFITDIYQKSEDTQQHLHFRRQHPKTA